METINGLTLRQHEELSKPLDISTITEHIKKRGDGQINLRHEYVRHLLNYFYGHHGWSEENLELREVINIKDRQGWYSIGYMARQRLIIHMKGEPDRVYDGAGAWGQTADSVNRTPVWDLVSDVVNGAQSVALCRAAKSLGTRFGLAFYADNPDKFPTVHSLPHQALRARLDAEAEPEVPTQYTIDPDE